MQTNPKMNSQNATNPLPNVGENLQKIRLARSLTLDDLSHMAGVSKSMLSQIEREKTNPTIAIIWRLANALEIEITELISIKPKETEATLIMEARQTPILSGHHAAYVLRILGPMTLAEKFEWYELTLTSQGELHSLAHAPGSMEHVTTLQGSLEIEVGKSINKLPTGGTARYRADQNHTIRNTGKGEAKALLVVVYC